MSQGHQPLWARYFWPLLVIALLLVAGIVTGALFLLWGSGPKGQLLTITKPVGGTISVAGITCGPRNAECSARRPDGEAIELRPEPEDGYQFFGYTGDCAPSGRTIMSAPRTCGATFEKTLGGPLAATQLLTISPMPTGGTIEGIEIKCGTQGSVCSANYPDGEKVDLYPKPDPGYTFMGFLGDCKLLVGHTQMTGPRTCGASFALTPTATTSVPVSVAKSNTDRGSGNRGGTPAPTDSGTNPSRPQEPSPTDVTPPAPTPAVRPAPQAPGKIELPPTDEEFAKGKIKDVLKEFCAGFLALDPAAVQRVFPKVNMEALKLQLSKSKYKSVQCTFGDPMFVALDAAAGTATVQADRKLVYEHIVGSQPPLEQSVEMKFVRPNPRLPWQIDAATYTPKKK